MSYQEEPKNEGLQKFHEAHESFTQKAFSTEGLLPDRYVFVLTNLCNLRCKFCFQKKDFPIDAMCEEDWINLAKQLPDYARVTFTGGEPLIFPGFSGVFSYVAERFDCNVITNGIPLTKDKIDFMLSFKNFRVLSLSVDDVGNAIRGISQKQWRRLEAVIKYFILRKKTANPNCVLDVKTLILDENAKNLFQIHKYVVEELGADTHVFQFLKGSPIQHADNMFTFNDIQKTSNAYVYNKFDVICTQMDLVRQYAVRNGSVVFMHPQICSLTSNDPLPDMGYINKSVHIKDHYFPCKFPWSSVHINADGQLFPCLSVPMGNVKNKSLRDICESTRFKKFRELIHREGTVEACNRCGWLRPQNNVMAKRNG